MRIFSPGTPNRSSPASLGAGAGSELETEEECKELGDKRTSEYGRWACQSGTSGLCLVAGCEGSKHHLPPTPSSSCVSYKSHPKPSIGAFSSRHEQDKKRE